MNRRQFLASTGMAALPALVAAPRPNFVLILADDYARNYPDLSQEAPYRIIPAFAPTEPKHE